ncbi:MAG: HAD family hydrolase [Clostridiaceae bacterium]
MKYKYILFDLDGTLTDSKEGIINAIEYSLNKFQIKVENIDSLSRFIGPPLVYSFMEYYGFDEKKANLAVKFFRDYYKEKGLYENKVYSGVKDVLENLKSQGFNLFVATSKPTVYAEKILKKFEMDKYFEEVVGSLLDGSRDEKSKVINYLIKKHKLDPKKILMIGDREHDVLGAGENNIDCVGVTYGYGSYEELKKVGATYIVSNVRDILEIVK